jgi:chitodextrinase
MTKTTPSLLFILLLAVLSACKNAPSPCFTVVTPADSIRVGHIVTFDASCSSDISSYYWDFGNGQTSSSSPTAQTTYDSATSYMVTLVGENSGKNAFISKGIMVKP